MTAPIAITVIICTLGLAARKSQLERAINSIVSQESVVAQPLVVLNGNLYSPEMSEWLRNRDDIRLLELGDVGLTAARVAGRDEVTTDFFCFLDDDDEIMAGGLKCRIEPFLKDHEVDVVSTNGFAEEFGVQELYYQKMPDSEDFACAALEKIWLNSGSALFKTDAIASSIFRESPTILEWTYIALRLSLDKRIVLLETPTFIIHKGAEDQMTLSIRYARDQIDSLRMMMTLNVSRAAQTLLRKKYVSSIHNLAFREFEEGNRLAAWKWHLRSITRLSGLKYITSTWHLIW